MERKFDLLCEQLQEGPEFIKAKPGKEELELERKAKAAFQRDNDSKWGSWHTADDETKEKYFDMIGARKGAIYKGNNKWAWAWIKKTDQWDSIEF